MQKLYNKLKQYSISDAIKIEESDRQYIALKNLSENIENKELYLSLILANAIICYQLSWKWENYWEEFAEYFTTLSPEGGKYPKGDRGLIIEWIISELSTFIKQSKNNKRFIDTKVKRLEKLKSFLDIFIWNEELYYDDMEKLRDSLAKTMKQKKDAKTIVFAVKMFSYWARNIYNKINYFPENINVPVDSRLIALYEKYQNPLAPLSGGIEQFYSDLSKKLNIPELHLDAIVWVNYDELIK